MTPKDLQKESLFEVEDKSFYCYKGKQNAMDAQLFHSYDVIIKSVVRDVYYKYNLLRRYSFEDLYQIAWLGVLNEKKLKEEPTHLGVVKTRARFSIIDALRGRDRKHKHYWYTETDFNQLFFDPNSKYNDCFEATVTNNQTSSKSKIELREDFKKLLQGFPWKVRTIIYCHCNGLTFKEIGKLLGVGESMISLLYAPYKSKFQERLNNYVHNCE